MAASAFDRLARVLDLEERQGWRNRAVIGGLQAMAERWESDAREEASDERVVATVLVLMRRYDDADLAARPQVAAQIRRALAGEAIDVGLAEPSTGDEAVPVAASEQGSDESGAVADSAVATLPPPEPTHVARKRVRSRTSQRSQVELDVPVTAISGIGSATAEQLAKLGLETVRDLIWHLPARHDDYSRLRTIAQLQPGEQATVIANLWEVRERNISMRRSIVQGVLADGTGTLHATWWNKYVRNQLKPGTTLRLSGTVSLFMGKKTLENPVFEDADDEMVATGRIAPVYPLTEGLTNKRLRGFVKQALDDYLDAVEDPLPDALRDAYDLPPLDEALAQVHFPDSRETFERALRRLAFDELICVQLGVLRRRSVLRAAEATRLSHDAAQLDAYVASLPFALTGAQRRVIDEIVRDLGREVPMTRMVQGDVGSGKTAVAAAAMVVAVQNGAQVALLAPTQILAEQHHRNLAQLLDGVQRPDGTPVEVALLTGRVTGSARNEIVDGLSSGAVDVVVGTTALIQDNVEFANLALVIVDEQHRFGVEQRGALRNKAERQPHVLVMSATPIPRSLALTLYGDLDLSIIDEMPPGRIPVKTKRFAPAERERLYGFMRHEAREGRQAFIVYPLVEESEKLEVGSAVEAAERLQREIFPDLRVALLHGRMSGQEKDEVMRAFAARDYDVLVSTTVIEVGIDVPNASLIVIEDAERFGLAQLHQLRGRVGRGGHKSYCALVSRVDTDLARERLVALESMNSGFDLAEKDLALRGPGDFLGTRQSGLPDLRVAQLGDVETVAAARAAAQQLFEQDPDLREHPLLDELVQRFWRGHGDIS